MIEHNAKQFQIAVLLVAQISYRKVADRVEIVEFTGGGHGHVGRSGGFFRQKIGRDIGDVFAVVGCFGPLRIARLEAAAARLHRDREVGNLHPGIVVIKLARDGIALRVKQMAQRVAQRGLAAVAHVQRAGRVG